MKLHILLLQSDPRGIERTTQKILAEIIIPATHRVHKAEPTLSNGMVYRTTKKKKNTSTNSACPQMHADQMHKTGGFAPDRFC